MCNVRVCKWNMHHCAWIFLSHSPLSYCLQMSMFTFFSAACVVVQMIATILTGDTGGLLKSLVMCEKQISGDRCSCCSSITMCSVSADRFEFEGVDNCSILTGLITGLMYGLCVLNIFGSLLCFVATILGCTAVARETNRNQVAVFRSFESPEWWTSVIS